MYQIASMLEICLYLEKLKIKIILIVFHALMTFVYDIIKEVTYND